MGSLSSRRRESTSAVKAGCFWPWAPLQFCSHSRLRHCRVKPRGWVGLRVLVRSLAVEVAGEECVALVEEDEAELVEDHGGVLVRRRRSGGKPPSTGGR